MKAPLTICAVRLLLREIVCGKNGQFVFVGKAHDYLYNACTQISGRSLVLLELRVLHFAVKGM